MKILPLVEDFTVGDFYSLLFNYLTGKTNVRQHLQDMWSATNPSVTQCVFDHVCIHKIASRPDMLRAVVSCAYKDMAFSADQAVSLTGCILLKELHTTLVPNWPQYVWVSIVDYATLVEHTPVQACSRVMYMESSTPGILGEFWKNPGGFDVLLTNPEDYKEGFWIRRK